MANYLHNEANKGKDSNVKVSYVRGSIYNRNPEARQYDVIVNPSNKDFLLGGGASGEIRRQDDQMQGLMDRAKKQARAKDGDVIVTTSEKFNSKIMIHVAAPNWKDHSTPAKMEK